MNFSLITEYPAWFIIFCLIAGTCYAFILYRRSKLGEISKRQLRWMTAFRFLTVTLLCFLLLGPMLRTITREVEKPIVILAVDNSQSVIAGRDSAQRKEQIRESVEKLSASLKDKYDLKTYTFGDRVQESNNLDFSSRQTDFSALYDELNVRFLNRNVGAIILASDGIYNAGVSPVGGPSRIKAPLYTIAVGDTNEYKDLVLAGVNHNKTAYLGNSFPLEVIIDARQAAGAQTKLTVSEDDAVLFSRDVAVSGNRFHTTVPVFLDAKSKGIKHYKLSITPVGGEASLINNSRDIYIEVVESKQKVLLLAQAPHPDLAAIKSSVESSPNYEVTLSYANEFSGNASGYNLIILHSMPAAAQSADWITRWQKEGQSLWFILGASTGINSFNSLETGLRIENANGKLNETQASVSPGFSLFSVSDELSNTVSAWPPLASPFGVFSLRSGGYSLLTQRIGTIVTGQPLLCFMQKEETKIAVLAGEGLWRWRLNEFEQNGSHHVFNELIGKTVQYLSATVNKSPFRLQYKNSFAENEAAIIDAELYNESGMLVNEPEVRMTITDAASKQYVYIFNRTEKAYTLNAGLLPVGRYSFRAETKLGEKVYRQSGEFTVVALQAELSNTIADHQLLYAIASRNGGAMIHPGEEDRLVEMLRSRGDITAVSYQNKKLIDLIEKPWAFIVLVLFLSAEWFMRKRSGAY